MLLLEKVIVLIATIVALLPVYFIKMYINNKSKSYILNPWLLLSLLSYIILMICYIKIFTTMDIASSYTILQILQIILVILIGYFIFNEKINLNKLIGIILGIVSIILLL